MRLMNTYLGIALWTLIAVACLRELGAAALMRMTRNYWRVRNRLADTLSMLEVLRSAEQRLEDKDVIIEDLQSQVNEYRRREQICEELGDSIAGDLGIERRPRAVDARLVVPTAGAAYFEIVDRGPYAAIETKDGEENSVA